LTLTATARRRFRQRTVITQQPATPQESSDGERRPAPARDRQEEPQPTGRSRGRPPLISDALVQEAHRRHVDQQQPLRRIAGELLEHTTYANARGVELAPRRQFKRRGWPTAHPTSRAA